ncbi:DUF177 domain-containing protein [Rapidithrix thailandica]|uniref:DUF177 domain-containing protein n=1 Tax=Rapidithrix thailandica TaxID=413964 RepID=A0AAW9RQS3_9BACT
MGNFINLRSKIRKAVFDIREFSINIRNLSNKVHAFDFEIGKAFFDHFQSDLLQNGNCTAHVSINKTETMMILNFEIKGMIELTCDRSLELFDYPVEIREAIYIKFGEHYEEQAEDMLIIPAGQISIELSQYIYEFLSLAIPSKKLHPKFEESAEETFTYSVSTESEEQQDIEENTNENKEVDPRWEKLRNLKF